MTVDAEHLRTAEERKLKKEKKRSKNNATSIVENNVEKGKENGALNEVVVKKDKKHKKKKSRSDGEALQVEVAAEKLEKDGSEENMIVDTPNENEPTDESRKEKKSKKKRKHEDNGAIDTDDKPSKKKKKRRDESQEQPNPVAGQEDDDSKPEKKKKKKSKVSAEPLAEESPSGSVPTATPQQTTSSSTSSSLSDSEVSSYLTSNAITIQADSSRAPESPLSSSLKPFTTFSSLFPHIPEALHQAFTTFKEPTPIQACCWPAALQGRDVVGIAETGSGKTLAFGVPGVTRVVKNLEGTKREGKEGKKSKGKGKGVSVLVLAPTRELAIQTHETLLSVGKPFGLSSVALYGGVPKEGQRAALREKGAAFVVGTPGRILDLVNEGACDLSGVTYLVLDEADRMLDKGFENDIRTIIGHASPSENRQTLMFSATWPDAVRRLASTFQRNPVQVTVGSDDLSANRRVEQVVEVFDNPHEKDSRLLSHLRLLGVKSSRKSSTPTSTPLRILVFVLYKKEASRVEQTLQRQGFSVAGIHGDLSQTARMAALDDFKTGKVELLVATDVAARGLDIPEVGTVINYSFPLTVEDYIHRIGRTGRGGRTGKSLTFFTGDAHERALAGEFAKVLREAGFDATALQEKFPMTIKKKTHSVYGAFYRDDISMDAKPKRMVF